MRIAFLGNAPWSVPTLEALAASSHEVVGVLTNPPRPAGRGSRLTPTAIAEAAVRLRLPLSEVEGVNAGSGRSTLERMRPDVLVVVAYGELLGPEVIALAPAGALNLHFSLLPRWRGAAPVQHALLAGDATTGVTVMQIDAGLDTGPILARQEVAITEEDDAGTLGMRLAERGGALLVGVLADLETGRVDPRAQDDAEATLAPKLTADDRRIDWSQEARSVVGLVRALAPSPGATTSFRGAPLKILAAQMRNVDVVPELGAVPAPTGTVVVSPVPSEGPFVCTPEGTVQLLEVAPSGRNRMAARDWARGARLQPGERFG